MSACPFATQTLARQAGSDQSDFRTFGYKLTEACQRDDETGDLARTVLDWVKTFLASPHPDLGRTGPVCPFTPEALNRDSLWIKPVQLGKDRRHDIEAAVMEAKALFPAIEPKRAGAIYKSLMIVFPDVTAAEAAELVDSVKEQLKPAFVQDGLMLGEFHENNSMPGLHNPDFFPLRSPLPMLVIRAMVPSDLIFLNRPDELPARRALFLRSFLQHQRAVPGKERQRLEALILTLEAPSNLTANGR